MGRKEKSSNATLPSSSPATTIISKRSYGRQGSNQSTSSAINQLENSDMNETGAEQMEESKVQNDAVNKQTKGKRRQAINKNVPDAVEVTNVVSTIAQRPRRQVKHKFIKSANINLNEQSTSSTNSVTEQSGEVNDSTNDRESFLESLSPNSKLRLVPMLHRLPINKRKLAFEQAESNIPECTDLVQLNVSEEPSTTVNTKPERKQKTRRGRSSQSVSRVQYTEITDTTVNTEEVFEASEQSVSITELREQNVEENDVNGIMQTEEQQIEANLEEDGCGYTIEFSENIDEEDDIMIVEEKNPLGEDDQIEYVAAEEVIIEETLANEYREIVCESPAIDQSSVSDGENIEATIDEPYEDSGREQSTISETTSLKSTNQVEPIYLSDSLSCFDSDSEANAIEMVVESASEEVQYEPAVVHSKDEDSLNDGIESADDVIIVPETVQRNSVESSNVRQANAENGIEQPSDCSRLYESTTDADDDSSEAEKRKTRSRRDNVARKNYSCRRTYARRKGPAGLNAEQQSSESNAAKSEDNSSNPVEPPKLDDRLGVDKAPLDCNTTDGTDEETQFQMTRMKAVRTYVRKKAILANLKRNATNCDTPKLDDVKDTACIVSDSPTEGTSSSNADSHLKVTDDAEAPKRRGRPRKKASPRATSDSTKLPDSTSEYDVSLDAEITVGELNESAQPPTFQIYSESIIENDALPTDGEEKKIEKPNCINTSIAMEIADEVREDDSKGCVSTMREEVAESQVNPGISTNNDLDYSMEADSIEPESKQGEKADCVIADNAIEAECSVEVGKDNSSRVEEPKSVEAPLMCHQIENSTVEPAIVNVKTEESFEKESFAEILESHEIPKIPSTSDNQNEVQQTDSKRLVEPTTESTVENISVKIEKIAIDSTTADESNGQFELMDVDEKMPKSTDAKLDTEIKKEEDTASALFDLPKELIEQIEDTSIRRSGRIRTINKSKQRSRGQGVVRDKKRPSFFDEDSNNASFDLSTDNVLDKDVSQTSIDVNVRTKTEDELQKEKIDRENGMKLFVPIIDNEYRSERTISKEAKKMTCDCFLTQGEMDRGELGCGDDCLNRMLLIECGPKCVVGERCTNRRFQKHDNSPCNIFKTEKKGYGLVATSYIPPGVFIMEYVGEVLNSKQFEKRANEYSRLMNAHYYFMALSSDCVIDATKKGNISRFINHSCDPNAETQKWTVNGELRIGFFSTKPIMQDEEITFDYQFQRYGKSAQKCFCEAVLCRGWIGGEPESDEELESEEDDESEDDTLGVKDENESSESKIVSTDESAKKKGRTPKPKKPKDATKKPVRRERAKTNRKHSTEFKKHMNRSEIMEDPDLDKEIEFLASNGLKNQAQTLQFSRLMVRAKLPKAKLRLLFLLREGELPCRRLFLDYHGLKLMHSWMSDVNNADRILGLTFRLEILQTLENLPITNKTALHDSKVLSTVQRWSSINEYSFIADDPQRATKIQNDESSPSDSGSGTPILNDDTASPKVDDTSSPAIVVNATVIDASAEDSTADEQKSPDPPMGIKPTPSVKPSDVLDAIPQILEQNSTIKGMGVDLLKSIISNTEKNTKIIEHTEKLPDGEMGKLVRDICLLASKLVSIWGQLPESFKIPKKLRIEQMKEHEREADEGYKETVEDKSDQKSYSTFSSSGRFTERISKSSTDTLDGREKDPRDKDPRFRRFNSSALSKIQRRQMFEAKVAQEDAERKKTMEHMIHEARCAFFQLDPRITRDFLVPVCVNPTTGQWFGDKMIKVPTPPSHSHIKPPPVPLPTDVNEYHIPTIDLPDLWKYAITDKGKIYYYHTKILIPQWEPPIKLLPLMEEHRIREIDIKVEAMDAPALPTDEFHETDHDDEEDDDVVSILSNSTMNANCLLELKSDPILEKYNDDDFSSTDSDDSELVELEAKYAYIKKKTDDYWASMKRLPNLNEEIAAMAKSDPTSIAMTSTDNARPRDEELPNNSVVKPSKAELRRKRKKSRAQLVQEIRISPLSEEMKRELRRDSRRYKENKAELRRQKERLLKRKTEQKSSHTDAPVRKLRKITEGLPQVAKHTAEADGHASTDSHSFSVTSFSSSRYTNNDSFEVKRPKVSAFASLSGGSVSTSTSSMNSSQATIDTPTRAAQSARNSLPSASLTQSIVNKLPSIGHKYVPEELIIKNTIKPIKPAEPVSAPVTPPVVTTIRSTPTQQSQPQQQQLVKKSPHPTHSSAKSSPKPVMKKKKTSDPNEFIDVNSPAAKKIKEKFKSDISPDIVQHLKPYFSKTCTVGRIQSSDDFKHLARKLTFFVMLKELKYCNNVSLLEVTDSVKNKAREYIKKYMSKFGKNYIRDENEKDFEDL